MKTVLQNVKTGVIAVEEIPPPIARPGGVVVRNAASLVSAGTEKSVLEFSKANYLQKARQRPDLVRKVLLRAKNEGLWQTYQIVSNLIDQPIQLGYSSAGVVTSVGEGVSDVRVGDRVACAGLFVATHSEVVAVPRNLMVSVPDTVPMEEAAFVALGAIAIQGSRLAPLELGDQICVYGLGLVGMLSVQLALAAGCRVIGVDLDPAKVDLARSMGADAVVASAALASTVLQMTGGHGVDKVLMCAATSSNEPIETVPHLTRQKGVLVIVGDVGLDIPRRAYFEKEIDIRISRSYGPGRYDPSYEEGGVDYPYGYVRWTEGRNMSSFIDLVARGRLNVGKLITHRFDVAEALSAYELIEGRIREPYLAIVITYPGVAAAPASVRAPAAVAAASAVSGEGIRIGFIGAGNFAKAFLLPAFAPIPATSVRAVCTAGGVSAATVARKYGAPLATTDAADVFSDAATDLVVIATRHDSHARYVCEGLRNGKAVYVEKPPAITLDELEEIAATYRSLASAGRRPFLAVGYNRRFSPLARVLRDAVRKTVQPLAVIYRVNAGAVPATEWVHDPRVGGGRIVGECGHFVDFISYLAGGPVVSMSAAAITAGTAAKSDIVTLTLGFGDGSIGTVHYFANGDSGLPKEQIEVFGGGVSAQLVNFRSLRLYGVKPNGRTKYLNQMKGFTEEAAAVIGAVRAGAPAPIPFEELYATSKATLLVEQAITSGHQIAL
jgi:predicted dehydrogenase/threonine dehydrogenase-like Zn-dependent dehydrogenase